MVGVGARCTVVRFFFELHTMQSMIKTMIGNPTYGKKMQINPKTTMVHKITHGFSLLLPQLLVP